MNPAHRTYEECLSNAQQAYLQSKAYPKNKHLEVTFRVELRKLANFLAGQRGHTYPVAKELAWELVAKSK